jgi:hypothetical protein
MSNHLSRTRAYSADDPQSPMFENLYWRAGAIYTMRRTLISIWAVLAVCLIATPLSPVMAQDIRVENYKNTVNGLVGRWAAAEIALASKLGPILDELAQKQAIPDPTDADKARIADLQRQRAAISDEMDNESNNLRVELMIVEVQPGAPKRELVILPDWLKDIVKAKGLPVGHDITLVPDADFDFKARKLKFFTVGLRFPWG